MMMTKKDYIALAQHLYEAKPTDFRDDYTPGSHNVYDYGITIWRRCCDSVAAVLALDNARFDEGKFMLACRTGREEDTQCPTHK